MKLARRIERRLESLLDGMAGRVFKGPLHRVELAGRLSREADLAVRRTGIGPATANAFVVHAHPDDLADGPAAATLAAELAADFEETALERGWRLEGPARVRFVADASLNRGLVSVTAAVEPGARPPWARLAGTERAALAVNRCVVGRGSGADTRLSDDRISRRHALVWRESGRISVRDLGSSNGTAVDGEPAGDRTVELRHGSVVVLGGAAFRFEVEDPCPT